MFSHSQIQVGHKTSIIFGFKRYFKNYFIKWILFCPLWHYHCRHYSFSSDQSNRIRQVIYAKVMKWWRLRKNFKIQFSSDVTKCIPYLNIFLPPNHRPALSVPARKPLGVPQVPWLRKCVYRWWQQRSFTKAKPAPGPMANAERAVGPAPPRWRRCLLGRHWSYQRSSFPTRMPFSETVSTAGREDLTVPPSSPSACTAGQSFGLYWRLLVLQRSPYI